MALFSLATLSYLYPPLWKTLLSNSPSPCNLYNYIKLSQGCQSKNQIKWPNSSRRVSEVGSRQGWRFYEHKTRVKATLWDSTNRLNCFFSRHHTDIERWLASLHVQLFGCFWRLAYCFPHTGERKRLRGKGRNLEWAFFSDFLPHQLSIGSSLYLIGAGLTGRLGYLTKVVGMYRRNNFVCTVLHGLPIPL